MKYIFLCAQPAAYLFDCIQKLSLEEEVLVFHFSISQDAPIDLSIYDNFELREVNESTQLIKEMESFGPEVVITAGYNNSNYLKASKHFNKKNVMTILMSDTPWHNNFIRVLYSYLLSFKIRRAFSHVWVPGRKQYEYMRRIGFSHNKIIMDLYSANDSLFKLYPTNDKFNEKQKTLIYIGRLVEYKGIEKIYEAFMQLKPRWKNGWKLTIIGSGSLGSKLKNMSDIEILPFIQSSELQNILRNSHAFILGSINENWGVAVHEAGMAGLPLLLSENVGAGERFLIHNFNGYLHEPFNIPSIQASMRSLFNLSTQELQIMSMNSYSLAMRCNQSNWVGQLKGASSYYYTNLQCAE